MIRAGARGRNTLRSRWRWAASGEAGAGAAKRATIESIGSGSLSASASSPIRALGKTACARPSASASPAPIRAPVNAR